MPAKLLLYEACMAFLDVRIATLEQEISLIRADIGAETKSSAGDKYETSREMMKQQEDKALASLNLLKNQRNQLQKLDTNQSTEKVEFGSVIDTDKGLFFVSIPIGKVQMTTNSFFAISMEAPLFKVFAGKKTGDEVVFNGVTYNIRSLS